jgi:hypothetical protein
MKGPGSRCNKSKASLDHLNIIKAVDNLKCNRGRANRGLGSSGKERGANAGKPVDAVSILPRRFKFFRVTYMMKMSSVISKI